MFVKPGPLDFVAVARDTLEFWDRHQVFRRLVEKNRGGPRYSFLDGPITANNPMGVHHARGRTYKDVFQRYRAMCGYDQRFQNGFDCQGLWVEVEVEKALGMNGKGEIEAMGLAAFARACRERVEKFAALQTEQSRKLGQWMDWPSSYYTMSDTNNAYNWHFLAECHRRGWLVRGHRVMPWCVRCGTSISQHEMLDAYAELTHRSVVVAMPIVEIRRGGPPGGPPTPPGASTPRCSRGRRRRGRYPRTSRSPSIPISSMRASRSATACTMSRRRRARGSRSFVTCGSGCAAPTWSGCAIVGPFDGLPAQQGVEHRVVAWSEVAADEGTGVVHVAPGCGQEDFELGRRHGLATIVPVGEDGRYVAGLRAAGGPRRRSRRRPTSWPTCGAPACSSHEAPYRHRYPDLLAVRTGADLPPGRRVVPPRRRAASARARRQRARHLAPGPHAPAHGRLARRTWATGASRASATGACPCPSIRARRAGASPSSARVAELRQLAVDPAAVDALPELHRPWIDDVVIRCPGCGSAVRRRPRGRRLLARRRHRPVLDARLSRGPRALGALVPRRLRRRDGRHSSAAGSTRCCSCR